MEKHVEIDKFNSIVEILCKLKYVMSDNTNSESISISIEKIIDENLKLYTLNTFIISQNDRLQNEILSQKIRPYLLSLVCSIKEACKNGGEYKECSLSNYNREAMKSALALYCSPYFREIFDHKKVNKDMDTNYNDDEDFNIDVNGNLLEQYPLNIRFRRPQLIRCIKSLNIIATSIQKYILYCPYAWVINLPFDILQKGDTRVKKKRKHDFEEYEKEGKYIVTREITGNTGGSILSVLSDYAKDAILFMGGPFAVEYFSFMLDITYKNENISNINRGKQFFLKTYRDVYKELPEEENIKMEVFNSFVLESLLNGCFLFSFCNFFSGRSTNNLIKKMKSISPEGKVNDLLANLYTHMNRIMNPFLKCYLIEKIIAKSYKEDYIYQKVQYKSGENDIKSWHENLCAYFDEVVNWEVQIYSEILSLLFRKEIKEDELTRTFDDYCALVENCIGTEGNTPKRGKRYEGILREIILKNVRRDKVDGLYKLSSGSFRNDR